jgi:hypothetical protein
MGSSGSGDAARATRPAEGAAAPYLAVSGSGEDARFELSATLDRVSIGRGEGVDLRLDADPSVSALHAELERLGRHWVASDDGLSSHGTYLNGERISGRHRLRDGDELRLGDTIVRFVAPAATGQGVAAPTAVPAVGTQPPKLTERQREVVIALARPFAAESAYATPATNRQIAAETHLSVDAVKRHLRILFERFGIGSLPQNEKRVRLVELALRSGLVSNRDLSAPPR